MNITEEEISLLKENKLKNGDELDWHRHLALAAPKKSIFVFEAELVYEKHKAELN
jgi:hypothetical protein